MPVWGVSWRGLDRIATPWLEGRSGVLRGKGWSTGRMVVLERCWDGTEFLRKWVGRRKNFCKYLDCSGYLDYICEPFSWLLSPWCLSGPRAVEWER